MDGLFGIENLKKAAKLGVSIGMQIETASKDGFTISDLFGFVGPLSLIPAVVANKNIIVEEFNELSPAELSELVTYVNTELVLENKKTEAAIEAGLQAVIAIINLVEKVKSVKAQTPPPPVQ